MPPLTATLLEACSPYSELGQIWENLVAMSPESGIMQSLHWADFKRRQGLSSVHLGIFERETLLGGAIFYLPARLKGAGMMVAPEGPVLPWQDLDRATEMMRMIMEVAGDYAQANKVVSMRIEPRLIPAPPSMLREFGRAPADLVPRETLYVDLCDSAESLLSRMKPKGRYNIALAQRHGITIVERAEAQAASPFYQAVADASQRNGFMLERQSFFDHLAAALCPSGHARFLLAYHEGDLLGSLLLTTYGERATYLYGGTTNSKRNLMAGYLLQWSAMQAARKAGCRTYDFYGFAPHRSPEHEYARFSQFKSQFGGQAVRFIGAHDYFFTDHLADAFVQATQEVASKVESLNYRTEVSLPC